jgi:hypothetical protein
MAAKSKSSDDLQAVLEAVGYELTMLVVSEHLIELTKPRPTTQEAAEGDRWMSWGHNAQIEAHLLHVRNLFEFFYKFDLEITADDFVEGRWPTLRPPFKETLGVEHKEFHDYLSTRLAHISPDRSTKVVWANSTLTRFFSDCGSAFAQNLDPRWRPVLEAHTAFIDLGWGAIQGA